VEWGATVRGSGELEMTYKGNFVIGNIDNKPDPRLLSIKKVLDTMSPVKISENIMGDLYSKLIINSCITPLGAICGLYLGEMLSIKKLRNIAIEIMRECMAVAGAMDIRVEVFADRLDYDKFLQGSGFFSDMRRHLLIRTIGFKYRRFRSSSLRSLEMGKPTEIDYLNGYISANGRKYNVPTPVNDRIIQIVKDIEAGRRPISPGNFDDPFFVHF
jgi:2-dehydropantoate 2-reductase